MVEHVRTAFVNARRTISAHVDEVTVAGAVLAEGDITADVEIQAAIAREFRGKPRQGREIIEIAQPLLQGIAAFVVGFGLLAVQAFEIFNAVAQLFGALAKAVQAVGVVGIAVGEPALNLAGEPRQHVGRNLFQRSVEQAVRKSALAASAPGLEGQHVAVTDTVCVGVRDKADELPATEAEHEREADDRGRHHNQRILRDTGGKSGGQGGEGTTGGTLEVPHGI